MSACSSCGAASVVTDSSTDNFPVCFSCGVIQSFDLFKHQAFDSAGHALSSYVAKESTYRELKLFRANNAIADLTSLLGLSAARADLVARMVHDVTDSDLGEGDWFQVLVAACSHIVMRQHGLPLSISEAADAVGRDAREVGRMVSRVVSHLRLEGLPEFDLYESLSRFLRTCRCLEGLEETKAEQMASQGRFLLRCCVKWSITTGRHPLPLLAAVIAFVAEVNLVSVTIEDVARETFSNATTARLRKKEIVRTLVRAAKALLPWGGDVNVKNIALYTPLLLKYMELKSRNSSFDLGAFCTGVVCSGYETVEGSERMGRDELQGVKLSVEGLSGVSKKALESYSLVKASDQFGKNIRSKRKRGGLIIDERMHTNSLEKLSIKEITNIDFGYDELPPSFISGLEAREVRRQKIRAAKTRILEIKRPSKKMTLSSEKELVTPVRSISRSKGVGDINWEDFIIELLILHGVKEEDVEEGQYKRLLDLHIFNSTDEEKVRCLQASLQKAYTSFMRGLK